MAVTAFKTFIAGEVLTAADLNSSLSQVFDNGESLGWPATSNKDLDGNELILDSDGDTSITADTDDVIHFRLGGTDHFVLTATSVDINGNELILDADADTSITADTDDRIDIRVGGTDEVLIGHDSTNSGGAVSLNTRAITSVAATNIARLEIDNTNAVEIPTGTTPVAAAVHIKEPNLTATGTITDAATLYVAGAPTEGSVTNRSLLVEAGASEFRGSVIFTADSEAVAKAWVHYDASSGTPTLFKAFKITSLTDLAVGHTRLNFTDTMTGADNYVVVGSHGSFSRGSQALQPSAHLTTSVEIKTVRENPDNTDDLVDAFDIHIVIFGEKT